MCGRNFPALCRVGSNTGMTGKKDCIIAQQIEGHETNVKHCQVAEVNSRTSRND